MAQFNRRDFIKLTAAGALAASAPLDAHAAAASSSQEPRGDLTVFQTCETRRHQPLPAIQWRTTPGSADVRISINPAVQYQRILGFGAAFTDAACYTLNRLQPEARKQLFHELFDSSELGLNVSRICIGSSDYSTRVYSLSDGSDPDPDLKRFSIEHDRAYILPILRQARAVNPEMWLLASPWSPPGWMKFNNSMLGGSMRRKWLDVYACYFERFLDAYAAEGVRVNSVTPQNEVDTDQDGRMPACSWPQEYEVEFVRDHLGPLMRNAKNPADIWILDHNYNLWGRVLDELEDVKARQFISGIAWHGYVGTPDAMTRVQQHYPQVDQFWTEGGPDFETPGYDTEWSKWAAEFTGILRNRARCIIGWNYALDENGNPNIGPFHCAGLVTVHSRSAAITRSGQYWALAHFSRHIRRDATILSSSSDFGDDTQTVHHVTAKNPDGGFVTVLTNSAKSSRQVVLSQGSAFASIGVPADSVTTLSWS